MAVADDRADLPALSEFVRHLGDDDGVHASSGAVAGLVVALAADLAAQVANASADWTERSGALAQADSIRDRAIQLAAEVEQTYGMAMVALDRALAGSAMASGSTRERDVELGDTLSSLLDRLLGIGEVASDAAQLGALAATSGTMRLRANAVSATMLACAAAEIVAHLVEINLLVRSDDERLRRAGELAVAAAASRDRARSLGR
jgi:formiminotetrahydrofolate cyclodeaminase